MKYLAINANNFDRCTPTIGMLKKATSLIPSMIPIWIKKCDVHRKNCIRKSKFSFVKEGYGRLYLSVCYQSTGCLRAVYSILNTTS